MKPYLQSRFLVVMLQMSVALPIANPARVDAQAANADPANLVVQSEGSVKVKRPGWTAYAPVVFGTGLQPGDLLSLGESSRAKVVCSDLTLHEVRAGLDAIPCASSAGVLLRANGSLIHTTRGWPNDGSYPTVVQPRKTKLLSSHPTLRWTAVRGASGYRIAIRGEDFFWTTAVPAVTQFVYPDKAPPLKPEVDYKLIVVASNGVASEEPGLGLGFSLLASGDAKEVLHEQKQIVGLGLPQGPTDYLIAHLYANHHLYAEAIERLEQASENFKVAAVHRLLGDLYMDIGLARQAEAHYLNSVGLSIAENDEEGQMVVHQVLAYIYLQILGNKETASQQLSAALELAKKLGDDLTASQAGKQLAELQKTGT